MNILKKVILFPVVLIAISFLGIGILGLFFLFIGEKIFKELNV